LRRVRVIPILTIEGNKLVKTVKFRKPNYIGDPVNAVKIFNEKEVDEIIVLDIAASNKNAEPNFELIKEIAGECFMPLGYGGGIKNFNTAKKIFDLGVEKIIINTAINTNIKLISTLVDHYGSQSIVACIDVKKTFFGKQHTYFQSATMHDKETPVELSQRLEALGVGEIIINNVDTEGTFEGVDINLMSRVANTIDIPVVACGGCQNVEEFAQIIDSGCSAIGASSMFVYKQQNSNSILINYPNQLELHEKLYSKI
jgi:imidazole glycerol-phosphate synthase subunit HisF